MRRAERAEVERDEAIAERDRLAETLRLRSEALDRVVAENDELRRYADRAADRADPLAAEATIRANKAEARLARVEALGNDADLAMDLWWKTTGDDWAVPSWLPSRFLRNALAGSDG